MPQPRAWFDIFDARPSVRASRIRFGPIRARGIPAILCGVAAIVAAAGASATLQRFAVIVPETLREARLLVTSLRAQRPNLLPAVVASLLALAAFGAPRDASADPNDVAFDQLQRIYILGAEPPPIGSFDDLRASFSLLGPSVSYPPLPRTIGPLARQREGVLYHYSFLGKLVRVDDVAAEKATIARPDKGEVDYLDLHLKTYGVVTGVAADALLGPNTLAQMADAMKAPASAVVRGTLVFAYNVKTAPLDVRPFEGASTAGERLELSMDGTGTGGCPTVSASLTVSAYLDRTRTEPVVSPSGTFQMNDLTKVMKNLGCAVTVSGALPTPDPTFAHFLYYQRGDASFTLPMLPAPVHTSYVLERAHLKALSAADAGLFEIPPGFTRVDPAPTAAPLLPQPNASPAR